MGRRNQTRSQAAFLSVLLVTIACSSNTGRDQQNDADAGAGDDAGQSSVDGGPTGSGGTVAKSVGPEGGTLTLEGLSLTVPPGALDKATELRITSSTTPVPAGYTAYSPMYLFEPDGTTFAQPVSVTVPYDAAGTFPVLFWSRREATGYERLGGVANAGSLTATVAHFSSGFVANGVEYTEPADRSCTVTRLLEGRTGSPVSSSLGVFFTVDDCQGRPVTGLTCEKYPEKCDFVLKEDGARLSTEASATILQKNGLQVFASLVLDLSSSTQEHLAEVVAGAKAFVSALHAPNSPPVFISVQLFAGETNLTEWQAPTLDGDKLLARLDEVASFTPQDASSTNLYQAVVNAVARLDAAEKDFRDRNFGGAFTSGYVVLFTDGADTAGRITEEKAIEAVTATSNDVVAVALRTFDFDPAAETSLRKLARDGVIVSENGANLEGDFRRIANRIAGQASRTYLLGYCSPKRSGEHTVSIEVANSHTNPVASYKFKADTFQPGCSKASFENLCEGKMCGGLGCGACDDRTGKCNEQAGQCSTFCAEQPTACKVATDFAGEQRCPDERHRTMCNSACADLAFAPNNCNACGVVCPTLGPNTVPSCVDGVCGFTCADEYGDCDSDASNGCEKSLSNDNNNCARCGRSCQGTACVEGLCTPHSLAWRFIDHHSFDGRDIYGADQNSHILGRFDDVSKQFISLGFGGAVSGFAVDDKRILVSDPNPTYGLPTGAISWIPRDGRSPTAGNYTFPGIRAYSGIASFADTLYAIVSPSNQLWAKPIAAGAPRLVEQAVVYDMVSTDKYVVWITGDGVFALSPSDGSVTKIRPHGPNSLVRDIAGGGVAWIERPNMNTSSFSTIVRWSTPTAEPRLYPDRYLYELLYVDDDVAIGTRSVGGGACEIVEYGLREGSDRFPLVLAIGRDGSRPANVEWGIRCNNIGVDSRFVVFSYSGTNGFFFGRCSSLTQRLSTIRSPHGELPATDERHAQS